MHAVLDKILIRPIVEKAESKIEMPEAYRKRPSKGEVILVGPGTKDEPMTIKEGEIILYEPFAGKEIVLNGETLLIIKQGDSLLRL
jgi:chaperonin GroES